MIHLFFVGFVIMGYFWGFGYVLQGLNLGLEYGMGMKKMKVYTLTDEVAPPKCIETMNGKDGESLADLRVRLEECKFWKFIFQYWDPDECYRVTTNIESLNDLKDGVFMIHALYNKLEDLAWKQQRLRGEYYFMHTIQCNEVHDMVPQPPIVETGEYDEILVAPLL